MLSNDTSSPNILCLTNTGIEIEISGLRLAIQFSCHHMYRLDTRVFNSTFDGTESSDTAFIFDTEWGGPQMLLLIIIQVIKEVIDNIIYK